jgi:hypothetical protein
MKQEFQGDHPLEYCLQITQEHTDNAIRFIGDRLEQFETIGRLRWMLRQIEQDFMRRVFCDQKEDQDWICYTYSYSWADFVKVHSSAVDYLKEYELSLLRLCGLARSIEDLAGTLTGEEPTVKDMKWVEQQTTVWPIFIRTAWLNALLLLFMLQS